jgi:hypothetical protein
MRFRAEIDPLDAPGLGSLGEKPRTQNSSGMLMGTRGGFTPDQVLVKFGASPPRVVGRWTRRKYVGCKLQQAHAVLAASRASRVALTPFHRKARLPKPNPTAHSSKVAVMLGHSSDVINHSARHQTEISEVQRQADIGEPS